MVVSNTFPINYLVLIEQVNVLPVLYGHVLIPPSVCQELTAPEAPQMVRSWIANAPQWMEIASPKSIPSPAGKSLHEGERDAIALAQHIKANALIIDERQGRLEAQSRGLIGIGTLGVLAAAHERGLSNLKETVARLKETNFHVSPKLLSVIQGRFWRILIEGK